MKLTEIAKDLRESNYNPMDMDDVMNYHYKKHKKLSEDYEEQMRILEQEEILEAEYEAQQHYEI